MPIVVVIASLALIAAGVVVATSVHHASRAGASEATRDQREREATTSWDQQASDAFHPLATAVADLTARTGTWLAGTLPTDAYQAALASDVPVILNGRNLVGGLPAFPYDRRANDMYWDASLLYTELARVDVTLIDLQAGPLRDQEGLAARRLGELADRVFHRGRALVLPFRHDAPAAGAAADPPDDVPSWTVEGLTAGPPLDTVPPAASGTSQASRPQEPKPQWKDDVDRAGIPTLPALTSAVDGTESASAGAGLATQQRNLADAYLSAAAALRDRPDPAGDREEGARLRLSLLVYAEAARQAEAGTSASDPTAAERLDAAGRRLLLIGDALWPPDLGGRNSGEPGDILHDQGA